MPELIVNEKYLSLVPRPEPLQYKALEQSIIRHGGCYEPIVVNEKNEILDGHTRYEICHRLKLLYEIEMLTGMTEQEQMSYILDVNKNRRHLMYSQIEKLETALKEIDAEIVRGKLNQKAGTPLGNVAQRVDVKADLAKKSQVSPKTASKYIQVQKKGTPETKRALKDGEISIDKAYRETKAEAKAAGGRKETLKKLGMAEAIPYALQLSPRQFSILEETAKKDGTTVEELMKGKFEDFLYAIAPPAPPKEKTGATNVPDETYEFPLPFLTVCKEKGAVKFLASLETEKEIVFAIGNLHPIGDFADENESYYTQYETFCKEHPEGTEYKPSATDRIFIVDKSDNKPPAGQGGAEEKRCTEIAKKKKRKSDGTPTDKATADYVNDVAQDFGLRAK